MLVPQKKLNTSLIYDLYDSITINYILYVYIRIDCPLARGGWKQWLKRSPLHSLPPGVVGCAACFRTKWMISTSDGDWKGRKTETIPWNCPTVSAAAWQLLISAKNLLILDRPACRNSPKEVTVLSNSVLMPPEQSKMARLVKHCSLVAHRKLEQRGCG